MFKGKTALVFGAGISGTGAACVLAEEGASVILYDERPAAFSDEKKIMLDGKNIVPRTGVLPDEQLCALDFLVLSPGVSVYNPAVQKARAYGARIIGEVELAAIISRGRIIAITGTNGKTTTTALLGKMIAGLPAHSAVGGNIGQALSLAAQQVKTPEEWLIAEVSSFQLESVETFHPYIAAILNLTPDHLDRHGTLAEYKKCKEMIFAQQDAQDYLVLNFDDDELKNAAQKAKSQVVFFSGSNNLPQGAFLRDGMLVIAWQGRQIEICPADSMKIFGRHNLENALAAALCAFLANVPPAVIKNALQTFPGVEHRIEYVDTIDGIPYYNDSKATNPESAVKALEAFSVPIVIIAGGYDKMGDLTKFMALVKEKTEHAIFFGQAGERFMQTAEKSGVKNITRALSFEDAVEKARSFARAPQVVLLSPACSSYDLFENFEQRGRYFKQLVKAFSR